MSRLSLSFLCILLLLGCGRTRSQSSGVTFTASSGAPTTVLQIRLADDSPGEGTTEVTVPGHDLKCYMHPTVEFTNEDMASSRVFQEDNTWTIEGTLSNQSAQKMQDLTSKSIGKLLVIMLDGKVISAPTIRSKIDEKFVIVGYPSEEEATRIAKGLVGQ